MPERPGAPIYEVKADLFKALAHPARVRALEGRGITVLLKSPRPEHLRILREVGAIDRLAHENHLFNDLDAAIAHARSHVERSHRHGRPAAPARREPTSADTAGVVSRDA